MFQINFPNEGDQYHAEKKTFKDHIWTIVNKHSSIVLINSVKSSDYFLGTKHKEQLDDKNLIQLYVIWFVK